MRIQHCTSCGSYQHYPRPICVTCGGDRPDEVEAAGTGTVDSFTVVHRAEELYVLARVRLTEGPVVLTHVTGVPEPRCDQPVRLVEGSEPPVFTGSDDGL
ncbi:OB-fold domain-containing protein [Actinoplanes hulinensis]|uniref:OB-fold domain-containing protein n=1 Tax=Actinoplanes hulinensis TaxID=1144547 RepID=A0ABS7B010_9ACTN|nr:OB-fold domain-containing protein [Actinoplanes hulinensis]MBW6434366.1 OB-fold domain-containing protein [Actinoplanes hulinensis]